MLSLSFVFSTTAQEVLGSCIFLFVKHPFDIGDRVDINDKSYVVERISLLFSVFRTVGDHRITQTPNNILNNLWIDNFTRANAMHEQLTVPVSFDTSFAEIQFLREEMELFVRDKENCRDFQPDIDIEVVGVGDMDKLELRVDIRHKSNWANETVRAARRSKFMCALVLAVRKIPVRAPGAATPEEESKDGGDDGDDKDDKTDAASITGNRKSTQTTAAAGVAGAVLNDNSGQTTGFDQGRSGTITHRGSTNAGQSSEAAFAERLNARTPAVDATRDDEPDLYRTATNASNQGNQPGTTGSVSRELSTGHRKAGTRVSYNEEHGHAPAPLSPVHAGLTPSSSAVPILGNPAPPGSRGSTCYEPPSHADNLDRAPSLPIIGSPETGTYNTSYYQSQNTDDTASASGAHNHHTAPFESERYEPVSPPSIYSPMHPTPPAPAVPAHGAPAYGTDEHGFEQGRRSSFISRTLKKGRGSQNRSPYAEHEA